MFYSLILYKTILYPPCKILCWLKYLIFILGWGNRALKCLLVFLQFHTMRPKQFSRLLLFIFLFGSFFVGLFSRYISWCVLVLVVFTLVFCLATQVYLFHCYVSNLYLLAISVIPLIYLTLLLYAMWIRI